jgi:phenylacetate-CoA ligase
VLFPVLAPGVQRMNDLLMQVYHRLPVSLHFLPATAYGFQLRFRRYGPQTERLVEEALDRERWSLNFWSRWQEDRLGSVLHRAATRVPYYRKHWSSRRRNGDSSSWECLDNWPLLDKQTLRENPKAFVADDCDPRRMCYDHTSGTSGSPLGVWVSKENVRYWFSLIEARWHRWYGVSRYDRWAMICGQLVTPVARKKPPFWVWNAALRQLYMSSYHLSPDFLPFYLEALRDYRIRYLWGYSSSLYALAQEALRSKVRLQLKVAITNAEPLFDYQRETIAEAFWCPVYQTYGMSEMVTAASECEHGRLHLWPEVGWTEVLQEGGSVSNSGSGDLVCTGLLNVDMPLIRYQLGDRGTVGKPGEVCGCGRTLPILMSLEGRADDTLYTVDGRSVGRLDPVFKAKLPIRGAQIIQEALDRVRIRYVPAPDFTPEVGSSIVSRLQDRMGKVDVILEAVEEIPRSANGKFRAVICALPEDVKRTLQNAVRLGGASMLELACFGLIIY